MTTFTVIPVSTPEEEISAFHLAARVRERGLAGPIIPIRHSRLLADPERLRLMLGHYELMDLNEARKRFAADTPNSQASNISDWFRTSFPSHYFAEYRSAQRAGGQLSGQALVVDWSPSHNEDACRLAFLLNRTLVRLHGSEELAAFLALSKTARSLFLILHSETSLAEVERIFRTKRQSANGAAVGLFYPFNDEESEELIVKIVGNAGASKIEPSRCRLFFPLRYENRRSTYKDMELYLGADFSADAIRHDLSSANDYVFAMTHSNGINAFWGSLVACSRDTERPDVTTPNAPPCFFDSICNRKTLRNERMPISEISSKVVFISGCYVTLLHGGPYAPETQLVRMALRLPRTTAVLATYGSVIADERSGIVAAEGLLRGESIGSIVSALNIENFRNSEKKDDIILVFGDPEFHFERHVGTAAASENLDAALVGFLGEISYWSKDELSQQLRNWIVPAEIPQSVFNTLDYHRQILIGYRSEELQGELLSDSIGALSTAIDKCVRTETFFQQAFRHQRPSSPALHWGAHSQSFALLHRAWFDFYQRIVQAHPTGTRVRINILQMCFHHHSEKDELGVCPYCGGASVLERDMRFAARPDVAALRRFCFGCGELYDGTDLFESGEIVCSGTWKLDESLRISIRFKTRERKEVRFFCGLVVEPFLWRETTPLAVSTEGARTIDDASVEIQLPHLTVPENWPVGSHFVGALVCCNEQLLFLRRPVIITKSINEERDSK